MAKLFLNLSGDYEHLKEHGRNPTTYQRLTQEEIFQELARRVYHALNAPLSPWKQLSSDDQNKVLRVLYSFCNSVPEFVRLPASFRNSYYNYSGYPLFLNIDIHYHPYRDYDCYYANHSDFLFTWLMWDMMLHSHGHHAHYDGCCGHHDHDGENNGEALAMLLLILLAAVAAVLTFIALYYILQKICSNLERMYFNEGWLQAAVSLASMIAGAAAGALVGTFLLSTPLMWLAFSAGISNPIGIAITGIVVMTILGAAGVAFITNAVQDYCIKKNHPNAIDPNDAYRFRLTPEESQNLEAKGVDPFQAVMAIIALRLEMAKLDKKNSGSNHKKIPSVWARWFTKSGQEIQEHLNTIRDIRAGNLIVAKAGDKHFSLMHLYQLSESEVWNLQAKGLDPIAVTNALNHVYAQLQRDIAAQRVEKDKHYAEPTAQNRYVSHDYYFEQISRLRNGEATQFELNGVLYSLRAQPQQHYSGPYNGYSQPYGQAPTHHHHHPSTGGGQTHFFSAQPQPYTATGEVRDDQHILGGSSEPTPYSLYPNLYTGPTPSAPPANYGMGSK
ncbi:hypothetical protein [Legionella birminghamensis]|nr:hypothetical protein [Legionella birminghamensis]